MRVIPLLLAGAMDVLQKPLSLDSSWKVVLSTDWDVLGPFPIHAREQQFISPSFPLNLSEPIDFMRTWPSAYADNGRVGWTKTKASAEGDLKVSFPAIRWADLRATEGWAALQHAAVFHTNITLYPPPHADASPAPRLLVDLVQGSFITVLPDSPSSSPPEWHAGNIYDMQRTLPRAIDLPSPPSTNSPTTYHVFVSGNYEIRLFGDPKRAAPSQSIKLTIAAETPSHAVKLEPSQDVVCDFVDGFAFGDAIGIGLRSLGGWWTVTKAESAAEPTGLGVELLRPTRMAPSQTRIVPLRVIQTEKFTKPVLSITLNLTSDTGANSTVSVKLPLKHLPRWSEDSLSAIKATYFYAQEMPTIFSVFPPLLENADQPQPPILCLHGAGVDIESDSFWIDSLPRQQHSWLVAPSGRTPWGLDWHGLSAKDAWSSVDALVSIVDSNPAWHGRRLVPRTPVVLMGHSNGGQGAWYLATRFPDRVLAVVPAAAYIKSQAYVPLTMSRSAHFIDPAVRAILESSLTPDDNDLFLSNVVDTPILAVHGGNDENVPVWHSRELVDVLETWRSDANVTFREDPRQLHWYPSVLKNVQVQSFLDAVLQSSFLPRPRSKTFTLTVAIPADSGSLHGWKIEALSIPGRLARMVVQVLSDNHLRIDTSNVERFSLAPEIWSEVHSLEVDDSVMNLSPHLRQQSVHFERTGRKSWKVVPQNVAQASGRIQSFLTTSAPFRLVVLNASSSRDQSLALRLAHDLNAYHRLDAEIVLGTDAFENYAGNILIIGGISSPAVAKALQESKTPFRVENHRLTLRDNIFDKPGLGLLFLHPHPANSNGRMLFLLSSDASGLERAGRLFPIRTGVTVPDWLITGSRADQTGAAGVLGAGVWGAGWGWNEAMSWLY